MDYHIIFIFKKPQGRKFIVTASEYSTDLPSLPCEEQLLVQGVVKGDCTVSEVAFLL